MTQNEQILALLRARQGVGITALEALDLVGTMRLASRISDLKVQGYDIESTMITVGRNKHVARYVLKVPKPTLSPTLWTDWTEGERRAAAGDR